MLRELLAPFMRANRPKEAGWVKGITVHTGSKLGHNSVHAENTRKLARLLPENGYKIIATGGGCAGKMGVLNETAISAGAHLYGISLTFFDAAQGEGYEGQKAAVSVETMHERMLVMRQGQSYLADKPQYRRQFEKLAGFEGTQIGVSDVGSIGTMEEFFEWLISRNGIMKPQVVLNHDGYYEPLKRFLEGGSDNLYKQGLDVQRVEFAKTPEKLIEKINFLNSFSPIRETDHECMKQNRWREFVEEYDHAFVVKAGAPLTVMSRIFSYLTGYDVSTIPGQTLWRHDVIKPFIFEGGYYKGIEGQIDNATAEGFLAEDRKEKFFRFVSDVTKARQVARQFNDAPVRPQHLKAKHSEGAAQISIEVPIAAIT